MPAASSSFPNATFIAAIVAVALMTPRATIAQNAADRNLSLSMRLMQEPVKQLADAARQRGDAVRGAILFTSQKLLCTQCHLSGQTNPVGPDLTKMPSDVTDDHLVESLLEPSKIIRNGFEAVAVLTTSGNVFNGRIVDDTAQQLTLQLSTADLRRVSLRRDEIETVSPSKVSAMPDRLVDQLDNRDQFLDLVRYLISLRDAAANRESPANGSPDLSIAGGHTLRQQLQGIRFLKEFNCEACHHDDVTDAMLPAKRPPDLRQVGRRIDPQFLQRLIASPHQTKPGSTMPDMMHQLGADERQLAAEQITHYLVSLDGETFAPAAIDPAAAARGAEHFHSVGCVACHGPRDGDPDVAVSERSVPLGPVEKKYALDELVRFLEDPLRLRPSGRMPNMQLTHWESVDIANYLLSASDANPHRERFVPRDDWVAQGKLKFEQFGCVHCHPISNRPREKPFSPSLPLSMVRADAGCLSGARGDWPLFDFSEEQRVAIQATLSGDPPILTPEDQIAVTITALRCTQCHQRGQLGGVPEHLDSHFQTTNANLGPQGRIPPPLTGVGAKLNAKWMRQVLVSGRRIRPYVLTRMPQYGADNVVHLIDLFQQCDRLPDVPSAADEDAKAMREAGWKLAGSDGLNCIACHTFQRKQSANMPAVDLTEMSERLKKNWFVHYMHAPQSLSPNTVMPSFWPGGRAMRRDILEGDRDRQIEAIWMYLVDGRQARTPRGLILEPLQLLARDEAVMLRRKYPDVGKRGIGVGYPNQVNLVFDAEQLRLAALWKGAFADASGVWRSQGHGVVRPLGNDRIGFAMGPDLDHAEQRWVADRGRPAEHRFMGYSLDRKRRPRFRYRFGEIQVDDYSVDQIDDMTQIPWIERTVTFQSERPQSDLVFRAATGRTITPDDDGVFIVDDRLRVRVPAGFAAAISDQGDGKELLVPIDIARDPITLTLQYHW